MIGDIKVEISKNLFGILQGKIFIEFKIEVGYF